MEEKIQTALDITERGRTTGGLYGWGISLIATALGLGNILLGVVIAAMPYRLTSASFAKVAQMAPVPVWGWAFVASGLVALFGQYTHRKLPTRCAHSFSAFLCGYWVVAFLLAAVENRGCSANTPVGCVSLTGCIAYSIIGVNHVIIAVVSPHRP